MGDNCCQGTVDIGALEARQRRVLNIVLLINVATFLMMVAASIYSGASSLLSGALDNLGDALTYALSLAVIGASAAAKARVALVKAALILAAAIAVALQIGWRIAYPAVPLFEGMGLAALLNLGANLVCLRLLMPYRNGDVNMASAWECSRNDAFEGLAVLAAASGVWMFGARWPDLVVAVALLAMFVRSAGRVFRAAWRERSIGRD
ncbi:MAG: cation transporter [Lysobacter sp.]